LRPTRITRLRRVEAQEPGTRWEHTVGISALLEAARHLPKREPWDLPTVDETTGMGKLLAEARAWGKAPGSEAC
jgi:hypothetical protein